MLNRWLEDEPKETLICAVASAVSLVLSITGALKGILPFDIAWVAIVLCGIPILVGAFKGVVFEHDIKADLLVSLAQLRLRVCGGQRRAAASPERYGLRKMRKQR